MSQPLLPLLDFVELTYENYTKGIHHDHYLKVNRPWLRQGHRRVLSAPTQLEPCFSTGASEVTTSTTMHMEQVVVEKKMHRLR